MKKTEFTDNLKRLQWVHKQANKLCNPYLPDWRERVTAYWEQQIDGIDSKQLLRALTALYGKEEAAELADKTRSDKVKTLVDGTMKSVVGRFAQKVNQIVHGPDDLLKTTGLTLEEHPYSEATVLHEGRTHEYTVDGLVCITGTVSVLHADSGESDLTIFSKWVSHPFWQYSSL